MLFGGGQEKGKRAGTENTSMIAGLGQAARLVNENVCEYNAHFKEVKNVVVFNQLDLGSVDMLRNTP